jgi:hypothetical protein
LVVERDLVEDQETGDFGPGDPIRVKVSLSGHVPLDGDLMAKVELQKREIRDRLRSEYQAIQVPEANRVKEIQARLHRDQKALADTQAKLKEMESESQELDLAPAELNKVIKGISEAKARIEILSGHVEARSKLLENALRGYQVAYRQAAQDIKIKVLAEVEEARSQAHRVIEERLSQLVFEVGAALLTCEWADDQPRNRYFKRGTINEFDPEMVPDLI